MKTAFVTSLCFASLLCHLCYADTPKATPPKSSTFSPSSRSVISESVFGIIGKVDVTLAENDTVFHMPSGSQVTLDFGVEVGGLISFEYRTNSSHPLALAFTESALFIGNTSDTTGDTYTQDWDLALNVSVQDNAGRYTMPAVNFRGGFRYLTLLAHDEITLHNVRCEIGFAPNMPDLKSYSGHFSTQDAAHQKLNQIWAAAAYTVQTNIGPQGTGEWLPQVKPGWAYNASLGRGEGPFLLAGAKRDRAVWPGDLGISGPAAALAFGADGLLPWLNSIETIVYSQNESAPSVGEFPYAGPNTNSFKNGLQSETYHAWTLITIYDYIMYSGDQAWLDRHWKDIIRGVDFILQRLDTKTGLHNQTQLNDWGRQGAGGYNSALNALDYHALTSLATLTKDAKIASTWRAAAEKLKQSFNDLLWDSPAHLYRDNTSTTLHPQDGNALALAFNLTTTPSQATTLSTALTKNWNDIGPIPPELPNTISPFITGLELLGHIRANQPQRALNLLHKLWGYLLTDPAFTGSTFPEGISPNGSLHYYRSDEKSTSLAHAWSSAPVQALISEVVGLRPLRPGGGEWILEPRMGNLTDAKAGFVTSLGRFEAAVALDQSGSKMEIEVTTPVGTKGVVRFLGGAVMLSSGGGQKYREMKLAGGRRSLVVYR